jgi:GT2 family glycosyltransferase
MNIGLQQARNNCVLFIDDDIRPEADLIGAHYAAHIQHPGVLVAGRVIQPWEEGKDFSAHHGFRFAGTRSEWMIVSGGNFLFREWPWMADLMKTSCV